MNKIQMPEPDCFRRYEYENGGIVDVEYNGVNSFSGGRKDGTPLFTDTQMEAYAAARVSEALEKVQNMLTDMCTSAVKSRIPDDEDDEGWNSGVLERALAFQEAASKICALIPNKEVGKSMP